MKNMGIKELLEKVSGMQRLIRNKKGSKEDGKKELSHNPSSFSTSAESLRELKVAAIMDRFTLECFRPECDLTELTPDNWKDEMIAADPDLLFVESAWEGKDRLWYGKINHCSDELYELTEYCHRENIPVVFWNKEDPVHTKTFLPTAKHADCVFTTDLDCIEKYKTELGHDRVYHLHFAAQPSIHNPVEKYVRQDRFCFAGAYYHRYQDRCRVFDAFSDYFMESRGFDIYDRNYQNARPEHKFPERYDPYILGRLDPSEIDIAYKGYAFGVNMNSITQSQTMFARRVFELMASNTIVVGNYSRGVKNYFGDLTFCTDDEKTLRAAMERYCADEDSADKFRLLALRKVLREHLMEDRLDYIVQKVYGRSLKKRLPLITVYSIVKDQNEADRVMAMFQTQNYSRKKLLLVSDAVLNAHDDVTVISVADFQAREGMDLCSEGYLANFCAEDWYGKNYLLDIALATRYGTFDAIGKAEFYTGVNGTAVKERNNQAYHLVPELCARRCMVSAKMLSAITGADLIAQRIWRGNDLMSVDSLNYCEAWQDDGCAAVEDLYLPDQGISMEAMEQAALRITPAQVKKATSAQSHLGIAKVEINAIARAISGKKKEISVERWKDQIKLNCDAPEGTNWYFYVKKKLNIAPYLEDGYLYVLFRGEARMNLKGFCLFYNRRHQKIGAQSFRIGVRGKVAPPAGTAYMKIAYRVFGSGTATLGEAEFGTNIASSLRGGCYLSRSNVLVLSNHYPAPADLYRNMFVHKRLTAYKENGTLVDMMCMNTTTANNFREFEGINVVEGQEDVLKSILSNGTIDTVCVHFLDKKMWDVLKKHLSSVRIYVWLHGAEIQPWWRREYNFTTKEELDAAKVKSEARMALWREVFEASKTANIQFVFVSQYFADEVFEDYKITLPKHKYHIIHNCIDTEQFTYSPKRAEDRKKLLSIRPYASNKYANDLTVKAILELKKEPWFHELEIALYGSGTMFEEILAPLQNIPNVHIEKRFFNQSEIAALHKEFGVFLTPTRMDAQGVSRDEAMSSGLVPVTNAVTAIPEFVSDDCGILAAGEDYIGMAEGIKRIYQDPELFLRLSENAAKRVRSQTSQEYTIVKELRLISPQVMGAMAILHSSSAGEADDRDGSSDKEGHLPGVSIFGSCMTRDCFRIAPSSQIKLCSYIARQSVVSAVSRPVFLSMDAIQLDSFFQKRMVWQDFNKGTFEMFRSDGSEWLIIDLIDERFALTEIDGSYVTKSKSAIDAGVLSKENRNIARKLDGKDYTVDGISLKTYISQFCKEILKCYSPDHIIIHCAFCTDYYIAEDGTKQKYASNESGRDKALNDLYQYMYEALQDEIPQAHVINCAGKYHGSRDHVWGLASVHYEDAYYADVMDQINQIVANR